MKVKGGIVLTCTYITHAFSCVEVASMTVLSAAFNTIQMNER
jgi:hypothetical protein